MHVLELTEAEAPGQEQRLRQQRLRQQQHLQYRSHHEKL